jgi:hypothetical protein
MKSKGVSSKEASVRAFKSLADADPVNTDLSAIESELYRSGSDRAIAVMFGSYVETGLKRYLLSKLRDDLDSNDRSKLFDFVGPLGDFASKITIAYAFTLIGPVTRSDLEIIRQLRNGFAHSRVSFNFDTPAVRAVCEHFQIVDQVGSDIPFNYLDKVPDGDVANAADKTHPKTRFVITCHNIAYRFHLATSWPHLVRSPSQDDDPLP